MAPAGDYVDVGALLYSWLTAHLDGVRVLASEVPADLEAALAGLDATSGLVQLSGFGGADLDPARDAANVDVDCYTAEVDGEPNLGGAVDLAAAVRTALLYTLPGTVVDTATVQRVTTISRPTPRAYDDESPVRRVHAAYRVVVATRG